MAGYRPKSLDELNNMYDKTIEAEKAIKKGTSLLRKNEEYADFSSADGDINKITDEVRQTLEIPDAVSEFIAKYSALETLPGMQEEASRPKPEDVLFSQKPEKEDREYILSDGEESEAPGKEREVINRDELMNEYMRIMNDEEDDEDEAVHEKKLSRKEKKKLRRQEKLEAMNKKQESEEETVTPEAQPEAPSEQEVFHEPVSEQAEEQPYEEAIYEPEQEVYQPEEEDCAVTQEEEKDDFDFPEDYTPEWMNSDEEEASEQIEEKKEKKSGYTLVKALLGVVLALLVIFAGVSTVFKSVIAVNTGKPFKDNYYVFTSKKDYTDIGIAEGDLVVTEKSYAAEGDIFAYIDFSEKAFEFGRHIDSITGDDGGVLIVAEKDGGRALISRDDCKGVVYKIYPSLGKAVGFITENYIVIIAAICVLSLIIVLTMVLALKGKGKKDEETQETQEQLSESHEDDLFSSIE